METSQLVTPLEQYAPCPCPLDMPMLTNYQQRIVIEHSENSFKNSGYGWQACSSLLGGVKYLYKWFAGRNRGVANMQMTPNLEG